MGGGLNTLATKEDISRVRKEIQKAKTGTIKWMVLLWILNITILLGVAYFKTK